MYGKRRAGFCMVSRVPLVVVLVREMLEPNSSVTWMLARAGVLPQDEIAE
jgi:hypothetical protein